MDVPLARDHVVKPDLDEFVSSNYSRLVGLLVLKAGSRETAEELAQESLLQLVKHWDRVCLMENPWAWLAKVAVNQSRSRWRRLAMAGRIESQLTEASDGVDPGGGLAELLVVVSYLPERQRTALLLRHYAHLSVRETADAMGCPEGTVKSLTSRAVSQMRDELTQELDDAQY